MYCSISIKDLVSTARFLSGWMVQDKVPSSYKGWIIQIQLYSEILFFVCVLLIQVWVVNMNIPQYILGYQWARKENPSLKWAQTWSTKLLQIAFLYITFILPGSDWSTALRQWKALNLLCETLCDGIITAGREALLKESHWGVTPVAANSSDTNAYVSGTEYCKKEHFKTALLQKLQF